MSKIWNAVRLVSPVIAGAVLTSYPSAIAGEPPATRHLIEQINQYRPYKNSQSQVTSVSQLSDIQPTDWAFQALQSLVERYGCIAGYPDGTFRGNRPLTRFEFAAGLNACLDRINELIAVATANLITRDDLATVQRLQSEFAAELATLRGRVDALEVRTAELEANQFSTTTKLQGEVAISLAGVLGTERAGGGDLDEITVLNNRVRLNFNTSFTGRDLLKVRLDAVNAIPFNTNVTGTNMTRLAFERNTNNNFDIGKLFYRFRPTKNLLVYIDAAGGRFNLNASDNFNRFFAHAITGSVSRFGRFNPIYIQGARGAGATIVYDFNRNLSLSLGYLARNASNPSSENGLFDGSFAALGQLAIKPSDRLGFGITYVRAYYPPNRTFVSGATGSRLANAPFGRATATSADHFGLQASWRVSRAFTLSGWGGLTLARAEADSLSADEGDDATIVNWAVTLAFPDLGSKGSLAGIVIGQPPKVTDNDGGPDDEETAWHLEGFYRYQITDNIAINPGLVVIINPEHEADNSTIWVGNIRTIFRF